MANGPPPIQAIHVTRRRIHSYFSMHKNFTYFHWKKISKKYAEKLRIWLVNVFLCLKSASIPFLKSTFESVSINAEDATIF